MTRDRSDLKVTASDALEFEPVGQPVPRPASRRGLKIVLSLVVIVAAGGAAWTVYGEKLMGMLGHGQGDAPLIRADEGPVKVRPENPGGLQVPNRDKLVYNRLAGGEEGTPPVEHLLPRPEAPLPMPMPRAESGAPGSPLPPEAEQPKTARVPELADVKNVTPPPPPSAPEQAPRAGEPIKLAKRGEPLSLRKSEPLPLRTATPAPVPPPAPAPKAEPKPAVSPAPPPAPASKPTEVAARRPVPSTPPAGASADDKAYRVQLAAARTPEAARAEWDRVRRKNLDLLGDLGLTVTKVDLGPKKGVFYRLRVGPLAGDPEARKLCDELAKRRIGCLVIKPGA
jgi:hypothetical protein